MLLPPLTLEARVPRRFKELAAAAQGKLGGITGLVEFYKDILAGASSSGEQPKPVSDIVGGIVRVEVLGEKYIALKNFGMGDLLYYLRMLQSFGLIKVIAYTEAPRRLSDVAVSRTLLGDIVVKTSDRPEAAIMLALYMGVVFDTPARHVLMVGSESESIIDIALNEKFKSASAYNLVLSGQALLRAASEGVIAGGKGRPWYEPFSDLSGIIALLGALQVAKIRPSPNRILGIRALSKIKKQVLKLVDPYGDYMLPRGTLVLEIDRLVNEREEDPLTGLKYETLGVGMAKDANWFKGKVSGRAFNILSTLIPEVKEKREDIKKELDDLFSLTFGVSKG
ncbi:MAG: hypothetical protein ABWW69_05795 [Pyrodictiaceae archaeon]